MATIEFSLDGKTVTAQPGETILDVARRHGKSIPTLCYDPRLEPFTSCFLCLVEMEGKPGFVPSCATKVAPGMKIVTDSPEVHKARKLALELLMSAHQADCVAPCKLQCPDNIDIQTYIAQIAAGDFSGALKTIKQTNPFPSVCGRVCPHTCEMQCRRNKVDEPVAINPLKRFVADLDRLSDDPYLPSVSASTGKKIAIVGAGPAGLSAAYYLRQKGHEVTVLEMNEKPGGMLRYGIPYYRLPEEALDREIELILDLGIELRCGRKMGRDFSLEQLKQDGYDAVLLSVGAWSSSSMRVEGEDKPGIMAGIDYLWQVASGATPELGKRVVVVGGGNTAIDAARTARRAGADVTILYRRTRKEMPAEDYEVDEAQAEGVKMHFLAAPVALPGDGRVEKIRAIKMRLGEPDKSGRRRPEPIQGSEFEIDVDTVISAIGQRPDPSCWQTATGPGATRWNTVVADERTYQTDVPWVFTAGDCLTGAATAIEAVAGGRKAALSIDRFVRGMDLLPIGKPFSDSIGRLEDLDDDMFSSVERVSRVKGREIPAQLRLDNFNEVELGIDKAQALLESSRCLECGCTAVDTCILRAYSEEFEVDLERFDVPLDLKPVLDAHPFVKYDPNKCILCARCVRICLEQQGIGALGLVNRGFDTTVQPSLGMALIDTECDSCGQCVDACPSGAMDVKRPLPKPGPYLSDNKQIACGFCSMACRMNLEMAGSHYVLASAFPGAFHNRGNLCVDGRFGHRYLETLELLSKPKVGRGEEEHVDTWAHALDVAADGLRQAVEKKGVAVLVNGASTNEEAYLLGRFAKTSLECSDIVLMDELELCATAENNQPCVDDLHKADLVWVLGDDPFETVPVAAIELLSAAKSSTPLLVAGSRATRLDAEAYRVLRIGRGKLAGLLDGLTLYLKKKDKTILFDLGMELGFKPTVLAEVADRLKKARRPILAVDDAIGADVTESLHKLCKAASKQRAVLWLRRAGNSMGRELMGLRPKSLPGGVAASDKKWSKKIEKVWGEPLCKASSKSGVKILQGVRDGDYGGLLIVNTDPFDCPVVVEDIPDGVFVVLADLQASTLSARADVVLPVGSVAESQGTMTGLDGLVLPTKAVRTPVGTKTLFQLVGALADAWGKSIPLGKPGHVWSEMARLDASFEAYGSRNLDLVGTRWKFIK